MNGNYEIVEGGWASEVVRFITGAPSITYSRDYDYSTATELWNILKVADVAKYIIMAGTPGTSDTDTIENGLAASHAYTVLSVHTMNHANRT